MDLGNKLWDTWQNQISGNKDGKNSTNNDDIATDTATNTTSGKKSSSIFDDFFSDNNKKTSAKSVNMGHFNSTSTNLKNNSSSSYSDIRMNRSKSAYSNSDATQNDSNNNTKTYTTNSTIGSSYADKFMERIISMAIPTITTSSKRKMDTGLGRIEMQKTRPQLSIQIMSKNSILLLQRLSIPFEIIDALINFINWKNPIITITGMLILSLFILKPINLLTFPLFYICFEIIIPAYMVQNPNIDESVDSWEDELPKPVNEFSREFLLNVTDLQNHMLLYVTAWDFINNWCWKLFYFRDEMLTWFIFVSLLSIGLFIEIFGTSLILICFPFLKLLLVIMIWGIIISLHPIFRIKILEIFYSEELRLKTMSLLNYYESKVINDMDLKTDEMEIRQIEIFELQYYNDELKTWQFVCYSKDIYTPNSHIRLNNLSIEGTATLDSIVAPDGWKFVNSSDLIQNTLDDNIDNETGNSDHNDTSKSNISDNNINPTLSNHLIGSNKNRFNSNKKLLLFDYEKRRILKEKRKYQKYLKKQQRKKSNGSFNENSNSNNNKLQQTNEILLEDSEPSQTNLQRRRASNDFNNILIDPLILNKTIIEKLETGIELEGWHLDLCPDNWVISNYIQSVVDIDEETKWVYDLVVMGNGVEAYSAGLGAMGKLKRNRGDVRRRRWIRYAVREIVQGIHSDVFFSDEEDLGTDTEDENSGGSENDSVNYDDNDNNNKDDDDDDDDDDDKDYVEDRNI